MGSGRGLGERLGEGTGREPANSRWVASGFWQGWRWLPLVQQAPLNLLLALGLCLTPPALRIRVTCTGGML